MKHRNLILITILAGSLTAAGFAGLSQAEPWGGEPRRDHSERMGHDKPDRDPMRRLMQDIELTDAQEAEIKAIFETSRDSSQDTIKQLRDSREAMHELIVSDAYSVDQVRVLADRQAQLEADLTVARIDTMHSAYQVLTPEQKAEMQTLSKERMGSCNDRQDKSGDDTD